MVNKDWSNGYHISVIRPGGTLVFGENTAINATTIIYTIGAAVELLLTRWWLNASGGPGGHVYISVYNAVPAFLYKLCEVDIVAAGSGFDQGNLIPPYILPTGYSIRLTSNAVLLVAHAGVHGYTYPVN